MEEGTRRLTNQHTYIYKENSKQRERKGVKRCWKWKNKEWRGQKTKQIKKKKKKEEEEEEEERDGIKKGMRGQVTW